MSIFDNVTFINEENYHNRKEYEEYKKREEEDANKKWKADRDRIHKKMSKEDSGSKYSFKNPEYDKAIEDKDEEKIDKMFDKRQQDINRMQHATHPLFRARGAYYSTDELVAANKLGKRYIKDDELLKKSLDRKHGGDSFSKGIDMRIMGLTDKEKKDKNKPNHESAGIFESVEII